LRELSDAHVIYDYRPIIEREPIHWPGGARVAFYVGLNVEHFHIDRLDRHGIRASVLLNSEVCERYPQIIEAGRRRNWAWLAHGQTNSNPHTDLTPENERPILAEIVATIEKATGQRPRGWMGPGLTTWPSNTSPAIPGYG
jgi:allantoinase